MSAPILVACLVALRTEFNQLAPHRDKGADGWIGDAAHQQESSDHNPDETGRTPYEDADHINEVHALDVDKDLGGGLDLNDHVQPIVARHKAGDDDRLQNVIWRGLIASRSWGWTWRTYTGPSKHFDHAHFSARYTTAQENDTRPWGVYEEELVMDPNNATVQAVNYFFWQAWRGATGQATTPYPSAAMLKTRPATPTEIADRFARNAFLFTSHADGVDPEPVEDGE